MIKYNYLLDLFHSVYLSGVKAGRGISEAALGGSFSLTNNLAENKIKEAYLVKMEEQNWSLNTWLIIINNILIRF